MNLFNYFYLQIQATVVQRQTYNSSYNLTLAISRILIGQPLIFAHPRDQRAVTRLENVHQLNIRRDKKLGFQLSHRQPPDLNHS